ncbi:MAG: hypothetical protein AAFQ68_23335 [Bacteroidota bacterium]
MSQQRYLPLFTICFALLLAACSKPDINPHTYYEGEWEIVEVIQSDSTYRNLGTFTLISEADESSFNPLKYSDPNADRIILGLRYMRQQAVPANTMTWFLDAAEKRFFLFGISPLKSWIQVYTIQEDEEEIKRNQEMTLFLDIRESQVAGQEIVRLRRLP